tara:strand:- start:245 stop:466 length:222 start_codon:yes stop_codon:yes gene_type:complete
MNDELKETLIDLVDYWNTMGTESDPGIEALQSVVQRASKALESETKETREDTKNNSMHIDPYDWRSIKVEEEW